MLRNTGEGDGNPLQYSCLENPVDRGAWWAKVQRVGHDLATKPPLRNRTVESYGSSIFRTTYWRYISIIYLLETYLLGNYLFFYFLRNFHTVFSVACLVHHSVTRTTEKSWHFLSAQ